MRAGDFRAHYTDFGVLPRADLGLYTFRTVWTLHGFASPHPELVALRELMSHDAELAKLHERLKRAIELDPNNSIAYWILGRIYHSTNQDGLAVEVYQKCININPDFYSAYTDIYTAYEKMGKKDELADALRRVLDVFPRYLQGHPDDGRAHMLLGIFFVYAGRNEEAKAEAAKALALNPADPLMLYNGACFYARIGEKRLALESLRNAFISGYQNYDWIKTDSDFDSIRSEPEYIELMKGK